MLVQYVVPARAALFYAIVETKLLLYNKNASLSRRWKLVFSKQRSIPVVSIGERTSRKWMTARVVRQRFVLDGKYENRKNCLARN